MDKCYSGNGEEFYDSIEDVIDIYELSDGGTYYEGDAQQILPSSLVRDWMSESIVEWMDERLFDEIGEASEGAIDISHDDLMKLNEMIKKFMDDNCKIRKYKVVNVVEKVYSEQ